MPPGTEIIVTHANAPLTVEGRRRLIERCRTRPIAHVAAEMGISRATASKWVNRYEQFGDLGLLDRSSTPMRQPTATDSPTVTRIEEMRRTHKRSAARIEFELAREGARVSRRTISRILVQLGLNRRRFIDPTGETNREPQRIVAERPGHMVHVDVKKAGRIPDGGGWRVHGRDSPEARAVERTKQRGARRGYVYLHSAVDGNTRLAFTEALEDEKGATAAGFLDRARIWFAEHGITSIERIVTDNGACYRSAVFTDAVLPARHQRITPYTPQHNGKVERYNRILAEEFLYARTWRSEQERADGLLLWNLHYNYHRPHGAHDGQPPASAAPLAVNNVVASYTCAGVVGWSSASAASRLTLQQRPRCDGLGQGHDHGGADQHAQPKRIQVGDAVGQRPVVSGDDRSGEFIRFDRGLKAHLRQRSHKDRLQRVMERSFVLQELLAQRLVVARLRGEVDANP